MSTRKENSEASEDDSEERPIMYQYSRINAHSTYKIESSSLRSSANSALLREVEGRKKNRLWESDFPKRNSGGLKTDEDSETLYECTGPLKVV